ncbi:DUF11 domain-containing protein [Candidatus Gottesmanbacteria bacterium]|nr:DUF11 domain-containing protein [Candidatus Gottesmanbacteria bacterium]
MKKQLALLAFLFGALLVAPPRVAAQECTTQYGGTTTCVTTDLTVNKQVKNPATGTFVENLGSSDPTFSGNGEVLFRLIIKNTGTQTLATVTVKDIFPSELTFSGGPGTFDRGSNTLTFTLDNLTAGETKTQEILAKVDPDKVNRNFSLSCVINTARVSSGDRQDQDTAQLCIQTQVLGVTTLPVAGFEDFALLLPFGLLGLTGIAFLIKRG